MRVEPKDIRCDVVDVGRMFGILVGSEVANNFEESVLNFWNPSGKLGVEVVRNIVFEGLYTSLMIPVE